MSEEIAAVCERCEQATTGRIYDPYICAACKIEEQEAEIMALHKQLEKVTESEVKYRRWHQEKSEEYSEVLRYKTAFKTLVEELTK